MGAWIVGRAGDWRASPPRVVCAKQPRRTRDGLEDGLGTIPLAGVHRLAEKPLVGVVVRIRVVVCGIAVLGAGNIQAHDGQLVLILGNQRCLSR